MKNIKCDLLWGAALTVWVLILIMPSTRTVFIQVTEAHPYMGGFFKFFILATMGDWLGIRISEGKLRIPQGFIYKAIVWGVIGMAVTLLFTVYAGGAAVSQSSGKLPFKGSALAQALFGSAIMNLTFGPMMYVYHKFGDFYIELKYEKSGVKVSIKEIVDRIDWLTMVRFSWMKTCIFIWIPSHTLVFLMPSEYRVIASAFLSIMLEVLVATAKKLESRKKILRIA